MTNSILAFILAFLGMNYEYLISQSIAAILGGSFFQLIVTFTLFTFALGIGALYFQSLNSRYHSYKVLGGIQTVIAVGAFLLPHYYSQVDPLLHAEQYGLVWIFACYLPAFFFGFVTGFEIPLLMSLEVRSPITVLAFDFFGMFFATLVFPTYIIYRLGLHGGNYFCAVVNLVVGIGLLGCERYTKMVSPQSVEPKGADEILPVPGFKLYLFLVFVFSFCSFSYEALVSKFIISIIGDSLFNQVLMVGSFILGLGLAGIVSEKYKFKNQFNLLIKAELVIVIAASVVAIACYVLMSILELYQRDLIDFYMTIDGIPVLSFVFFFIPLLFGFITGFELPLVLAILGLKGSERASIKLLTANYFGALVAGLATSLLLIPELGTKMAIMVIAIINIVAVYLLMASDRRISLFKRVLLTSLCLGSMYLSILNQDQFEMAYLKIHYADLSLFEFSGEAFKNLQSSLKEIGPVKRFESKYQYIDLVMGQESILPTVPKAFSLYLNGHPQFSSIGWTTYHESFVWGAINLNRSIPKNVLILGAGDGLLAKVLLDIPEIESIDLVELDPKMIELANRMPNFTRLNEFSLLNSKMHVHIDDAYNFARRAAMSGGPKYDAIFIDFPYPTNYDLTKLYSVEFYSSINRILAENGFVILDAPLSKSIDSIDDTDARRHSIIISTLHEAQFKNLFAFGPYDPFIFATKNIRKLNFDYGHLPERFKNRSFVNLKDIHHIVSPDGYHQELVNSVYQPKWIQ